MGLQEHTWSSASQWGNRWAEVFRAMLPFSVFQAKLARLTVHFGMYARHTEIAKIAFLAVLSTDVPEAAARSRSEIRFFSHFQPEAPHLNSQSRCLHLMRSRWCVLFAISAFGCLHSSNKLH